MTADIFTWSPPKGTKYDVTYFDIWPDICTDSLKEIARLHQRFGPRMAPGGWIGSWMRYELQRRKAREGRQGFGWASSTS